MRVVGIRYACTLYNVHYIEQKDCTLSVRLGKRQGVWVYERLLITNFTR